MSKALNEILDSVGGLSGHEGTLDDPQWDRAGRVHDWRNHVADAVKAAWPALSLDARVVAYGCARVAADREAWD